MQEPGKTVGLGAMLIGFLACATCAFQTDQFLAMRHFTRPVQGVFQDTETLAIRIEEFPDEPEFAAPDEAAEEALARRLEERHARGRERVGRLTMGAILGKEPTGLWCPQCHSALHFEATGVT